jgi:hypothetical protein
MRDGAAMPPFSDGPFNPDGMPLGADGQPLFSGNFSGDFSGNYSGGKNFSGNYSNHMDGSHMDGGSPPFGHGPNGDYNGTGCPPASPAGGMNMSDVPVCARAMSPSAEFQSCATEAMMLQQMFGGGLMGRKEMPPATSNCSATEGGEDAMESVAMSFPCFQSLVESMTFATLSFLASNGTGATPVCPTPEYACNCFAVRAALARCCACTRLRAICGNEPTTLTRVRCRR